METAGSFRGEVSMHRLTVVLAALLGLMLGIWVARPESAITRPDGDLRHLERRAETALLRLLRDDVLEVERSNERGARFEIELAASGGEVEVLLDRRYAPLSGGGGREPTLAQVSRARALARMLARLPGVLEVERKDVGSVAYEVELSDGAGEVVEVFLDGRMNVLLIDRPGRYD
jgi:hypothetical protein